MNLTELSNCTTVRNNPKIVKQIKNFLDRSDVKGTKGAQRVEIVCENFKFLTFEEAYRVIDPDAFQDEFEETQLHKRHVKFLNYMRIILSLLPLILTWLALFSAASGYQDYLKNHSEDGSVAFLQLWQGGFHNASPLASFFTFSTTAIINVILLILLLTSTILALRLEHSAHQVSKQFARGSARGDRKSSPGCQR